MPPCSWIAWRVTSIPAIAARAFARDTAAWRMGGSAPESTIAAALSTLARVSSSCSFKSASPVLERLETADRLAELLPGAQVVERQVEGLRHDAQHGGGRAERGVFERILRLARQWLARRVGEIDRGQAAAILGCGGI